MYGAHKISNREDPRKREWTNPMIL